MKKTFKIVSLVSALLTCIAVTASAVTLDAQVSTSTEEIYPGVVATDYFLEEGGAYSLVGPQYIRTIEFDPTQEDLAFDVVMAGQVGEKKPVSQMVDEFNATNTENKKVIAAVNGDLWMTAEHHSRVEGESSDPVVKKELCVPRGYNIVDGEIICSQNMIQETPYDENFYSFGIAEDGTPYLGNIVTTVILLDGSRTGANFTMNGINRLPADNTIVLYTDKGPISNYCLDDAYEIVIDCDYDYTVRHGERITGKVTAICEPGSERYTMQENRFIITARGDKIEKVSGVQVGDEVTVSIKIKDTTGNSEAWYGITEACGGHIPVIMNGEPCNTGNDRYDPMTLIGFKPDGKVVMIVNDGRQSGYSVGINRTLFDELCVDLGVDTAFLLDGGGSTTVIEMTDEGYELKNRPSDPIPGTTMAGYERPVINAVVLSQIMPPAYTTGDINNDTLINSADMFRLKLFIKTIVIPEETERLAADINGDGLVNAGDTFHLSYRILYGVWINE
ncbi:MAG: phosphodiester glycosidase family protein [Clostridia bacterium]|nr:phosphodiester glycosidase family protein [Clostridia bacterium]